MKTVENNNIIYKSRIRLNMSQEELAEKIGVSRNTIQRWESGAKPRSADYVMRMAMVFGMSVDDLTSAIIERNNG